MRHRVFGKQLSRTKNERRRLLQGLARELILRGSITTTIAKAKAVQPMVEKLVTHAKKGSAASIKKVLADWQTMRMLRSDAKTRFGTRTSGYTRIIKLASRAGDSAQEVMLAFVDPPYTSDVKQLDTSDVKKPIKKK